jgi:hypothetical protein
MAVPVLTDQVNDTDICADVSVDDKSEIYV